MEAPQPVRLKLGLGAYNGLGGKSGKTKTMSMTETISVAGALVAVISAAIAFYAHMRRLSDEVEKLKSRRALFGKIVKIALSVAVGAAVMALVCRAHASDLFLPAGVVGGAVTAQSVEMAPDARRRRVRIAREELHIAHDDLENAGTGRLLLNVADGAHFDVIVERTAPTKFGYSLSGRVAGGAGGFVTLVVHEEAVAGSIWTPNSEYELYHLGSGIHALRDVTNASSIECDGTLPSELSAADATVQGGTDDGSVDILVVWTPEAEEEYGGSRPQVLSRIDLMIAYANDAFERSGAFVSLNLVGAEKVDYVETESSARDLVRLFEPDDGHMDGVHEQRDALSADLVYLLTARGGGLAISPGEFSLGGVGSVRVFAHEVGHNMGLGHDRLSGAADYFFFHWFHNRALP